MWCLHRTFRNVRFRNRPLLRRDATLRVGAFQTFFWGNLIIKFTTYDLHQKNWRPAGNFVLKTEENIQDITRAMIHTKMASKPAPAK